MLSVLALKDGVSQGVATWLETSHDFGAFREELKQVTCSMRVVNTGDSALIIKQVRTSCGCTVSKYPHRAIAPGDTAAVLLTYSSTSRPGQFEKTAFVYTTGSVRKTQLSIKGNVIGSPSTIRSQFPVTVGDIHLEEKVIPVGEMERGTTKMVYIHAYNTATGPVRLSVESAVPHIKVSAIPDTVPAGERATITAFYDTALAPNWGRNNHTFSVSASPLSTPSRVDSIAVEMGVIVTDKVTHLTDDQLAKAPEITLSESKLDLGEVTRGDIKQATLTLRNTGKSALELRDFIPLDDGISVTCDKSTVKSGKKAIATVSIDTNKITQNVINITLRILSNDPRSHNKDVRIVGTVKR